MVRESEGIDVKDGKKDKKWKKDSFAGKLSDYKKLIEKVMADINNDIERTHEYSKTKHAAYQVVEMSFSELDELQKRPKTCQRMGPKHF